LSQDAQQHDRGAHGPKCSLTGGPWEARRHRERPVREVKKNLDTRGVI
jgi:hypothetical protein